MHFRQERNFLKSLCKGHIQDLVMDVGWSPLQCVIVKKRYLEFKSMPRICMETNISESQYTRSFNEIFSKLSSYIAHHKDSEIVQMYYKMYNK